MQKMLLDSTYAKRYHADKLPDKKFTTLLMNCFQSEQKDKISALDNLYTYVMQSGGGFDIGKFVGRRKIEKR